MSPKDFEALRRKELAANKLQLLVVSAATVSNSEISEDTKESSLIQMKANEILNDWFDEIRNNSKIEILLENRD